MSRGKSGGGEGEGGGGEGENWEEERKRRRQEEERGIELWENEIKAIGELPIWTTPFLLKLREMPNVRAACVYAGVSRANAYLLRERNDTFRKLWNEAVQDGIDLLEEEAVRRATVGKSDSLLIILLKAYRPEIFARDSGGGRLGAGGAGGEGRDEEGREVFTLSDEERAERLQQLIAKAEERQRAGAGRTEKGLTVLEGEIVDRGGRGDNGGG